MKCGSDVSGEQGSVATAMLPVAQERDATDAVLDMLKQATIGEYEIHRELGRGGMATVYLAHDIALDRKVAIKVMSPALLLMGEGMTERFKREARTAANLSHPHIIPIYTVKSSGKSLFFVMKFIAGRSLEAIIKDIGPMPVSMVKAILQQVGHALGYAHRHGVVHRDVKPANIMIDEEGWSVVTDFGIAKVAENRGLTMTGIAVGTPSYMSPEQCAAKDITGKSDQYSFGVVAYEMLTGKQPFEGDSAMAIMFAHFHEQPRPILDARPDCPPELATCVMRMLEKAPDKRWGSMEEVVSALGAQPLAHNDPTRLRLVELAKKGSTREILKQITPPPTSPVPPAKTRAIPEAATTPIPTPKIVSVGITPARSDLHVGDTMQLTATPRASGGATSAGRVGWASADPGIATVSATGLVMAMAPGKAIISATCEGVSGSATITVTPVPVATVLVEPVGPELTPGDELQFRVTLKDQHGATLQNREVKWSASPSGVIKLSPTGQATALKEGTVEVIAESEGVRGGARLSVAPAPVANVVVAPAELSLRVGETATLEATLTDRAGTKLSGRETTWQSSSEKIATVSERGVVTALAEGKAEITAIANGKRATAQVKVAAAPVATVLLAEPKPVIAGERVQLQVQLKDTRGAPLAGRTVKWTSSSPAVATVTGDGQLTGMGPGSARVMAECEGKSAAINVTVLPVPVASVAIEGSDSPLEIGASVTLKAIARDAKGNLLQGRDSTWASSATKVAAVSPQGVVTAKGAGEATISVTIEGKNAERRIRVSAPAVVSVPDQRAAPDQRVASTPDAKTEIIARGSAPTEIITPPQVRREPEERRAVEPAPSGGKGKLIGAVLAVLVLAGIGVAVLRRGGSNNTIPAAPSLPAAPSPVAAISITSEPGPVAVGHTRQLAALLRDSAGQELSGREVSWSSSDAGVAEVSSLGAVTGRKAGAATITATSEGRTGTLAVTVEPAPSDAPPAVASVVVTGGGKAIDVGETVQLAAATRDAKGNPLADRTVVWNTGDPQVALVSSSGLVTAVGPGGTAIQASSEGKSAEARVTVNPPKPAPAPPAPAPAPAPAPTPVAVASVTLAPNAPAITVGEAVRLSATVLDDRKKALTDRTVIWKSGDERIARVDGAGLVTGVAKGTVTITATVEKKSADIRVTVNEAIAPVASVAITANGKSLKVGETASWSAVARDPKGKELADRAISWTSSAPQVASVNASGTITGVSPGTAEIRADAEGKSASERVTVAAAPAPVTPTPAPAPAPAPGPPAAPPAAASAALLPRRSAEAGGGLSCGIAQSGAVCWGGAREGLIAVDGTAGISQLSVGRTHACGLVSGGRAVCWGDNKGGQLGDGSLTSSASAVAVAGELSFSMISAGAGHTCGIAGGKVYCWGRGKDGQLGDGSANDRKKPVPIKGGGSFIAVSAGGNHTCAVTASGKAYCWGDGFSGQLGFGAQERQIEPVDVSGDQKFSRIAAGGKHTCGLTTGGKAFCWGANDVGQVGDGSKSDRPSPTAVTTGQTFTEISAGGNHTCALTSGGEAFCWGENGAGQLGDGSKVDRNKPVAVSGGFSFTSISAGEGHSCGMTRTEAVCWGRNDRGQLGDGSTTPRGTPAPVRGE
jgi:serine/threonine protein kinase